MKQVLVEALLQYSGTIIAALLSLLGGLLLKLIAPLIKDARVRTSMQLMGDVIRDSVLATNQTFVDKIRRANQDGVVTPEELAEAKRAAIEEARAQLGKHFLDRFAKDIKSDAAGVDRIIDTKVEAHVQRVNLIKSGAAPAVKSGNVPTIIGDEPSQAVATSGDPR